ncbi:MAG TPA: hypothetical protein VMQ45_06625, partial [Burkholderiaceae bacterium]|nr:hypothetical protein [Burkholderiaceae bacterium]
MLPIFAVDVSGSCFLWRMRAQDLAAYVTRAIAVLSMRAVARYSSRRHERSPMSSFVPFAA